MDKEKMTFSFVQLSNDFDMNIIVDKRSEIVRYGEDNQYPNKLLELSTQSALHTAILDQKIKLGVGEGISYDGPTNKKTEDFIKSPNPYESLDDILLKCYTDLEIFNGFGLQVIWTKDKSKIAEIYHTPFQNIRSSKANEKGFVDSYFYYDDWKLYTRTDSASILPTFNINENKLKSHPQLMYAKKYSAKNIYYPVPSYCGGIDDINTLYTISRFHNQTIKNNFQPGIMIFFKGPDPGKEVKENIIEQLTLKYKNNAGTPGIFFLTPDMEQPVIEQAPISGLDKQYQVLSDAVKENILIAHQMQRIVSGLKTPGSLGGGNEYISANEVFMNNYVKKNQAFLLRWFNKIAEVNGLKQFTITNSKPSLYLLDTALLENVFTVNEIRELYGYDEIEEGTNDEGDVVIEQEPEAEEQPEMEKNNIIDNG